MKRAFMSKGQYPDIKLSEVTPKELYLNRRKFMAMAASLALSGFAGEHFIGKREAEAGEKLSIAKRGEYTVKDRVTSYENATTYNNFYEFTTEKEGIDKLARKFRARPWKISVEGHVKKPKVFDYGKLIAIFPLEERIYRLRCVEAWSMVIPWIGFPLGDLLKKCEPTSQAKYVTFTSLLDPGQMPGQLRGILKWPYMEGLRMDEAMHPLTLLAAGMYGELLPNQNGAPLRLVIPWKYGFKSIKSIVKINLVEKMPVTTWVRKNPREYGFYANVNPNIDHPRWSQARERRIGELRKRKTLLFNGYGKEVAHLYEGMDLKKYF
jgi:sulfoxide reductase catalytic subunit YedY